MLDRFIDVVRQVRTQLSRRRRMKPLLRSILLTAVLLPAHEIISTKLTWTQEISRIFYRRCLDCHGPKSSIPLTAYNEVRPWAVAIREEVLERRMPPWDAVRGFGEFRNDASLTLVEIDRIVQWVEGGAPKGDDVYLENLPLETPAVQEPERVDGFLVKDRYRLRRNLKLYGLEPRVEDGSALQVMTTERDGSQRHLLWIPAYRKRWHRTYWLREPLLLKSGSEIFTGGAEVFVVTSGKD